MAERFLGITVMPEWFQYEGVEPVLDRLKKAKVTAIATSPYVMEPADAKTGVREPPDDSGAGNVRLLDRDLWGRRELFVKTAPSFVHEKKRYAGLKYQPADPGDLTRSMGGIIERVIAGAKARGFTVYFQIQAAIPPGYRVQFGGPKEEDRPRLPEGKLPARRLAANGSLACEEIRRYTAVLIGELFAVYPRVDGLRVDWPEYPPYFLDDLFLDFCPHARQAARRLGFDFEAVEHAAEAVYDELHGHFRGGAAPWERLGELSRFKAALAAELLGLCREAVPVGKEFVPNAFPPPFSVASGFDYAQAAKVSSSISAKLYTMHWPMMARFWADVLQAKNPGVDERLITATVARWMDIYDGKAPSRITELRYPEPNEPHPVGAGAQERKIRVAQQAAGKTPVNALVHGYGPLADFRKRLEVGWKASGRRVWINRYAYLSDAKLNAIGEVFTQV